MKYLFLFMVMGLVFWCSPCPPPEGEICLPYCKWVMVPDSGGVPRLVRVRADSIDTDGIPNYPAGLVEANRRFNQTRSGVRQWLRDAL